MRADEDEDIAPVVPFEHRPLVCWAILVGAVLFFLDCTGSFVFEVEEEECDDDMLVLAVVVVMVDVVFDVFASSLFFLFFLSASVALFAKPVVVVMLSTPMSSFPPATSTIDFSRFGQLASLLLRTLFFTILRRAPLKDCCLSPPDISPFLNKTDNKLKIKIIKRLNTLN